MSVVIRRSGYAYTWTCTVLVTRKGKKEKCGHRAAAATEDEAKAAYAAHKKTAAGH